MNFYLLLSVFSAVLGMFQYGFALSVLNPPQDIIQEFIRKTFKVRYGVVLTQHGIKLCFSVVASITKIGGLVGSLLGGTMADRYGRRKALLFTQLPLVTGALAMAVCKAASSFEPVLLGRLFTGFGNGLFALLSPLYVSEVAPIGVRGAVGTFNQLAVTSGILAAMTLGLSNILGTEELWPLLLSMGGPLALLQTTLICLFIPETPLFLINVKKDLAAGERALERLHGLNDGDDDLVKMLVGEIRSEQPASSTPLTIVELLCSSSLRMPLLVCVCIHLSQQLSGIMALTNYSTTLLETAGLDPNISEYCTLSLGVSMVVVCLLTIPLMDRFGRRALHLSGLFGIIVGSACITLASNVNNVVKESSSSDTHIVITAADWILMASILTFGASFAMGPSGIPWMIIAELFPESSRGAAASVATFANWLAALLVTLSFPQLEVVVPQFSFLPFTFVTAVLFLFLFFYFPETKNQSASQNLYKLQTSTPITWRTAKPSAEAAGGQKPSLTYGAIRKREEAATEAFALDERRRSKS